MEDLMAGDAVNVNYVTVYVVRPHVSNGLPGGYAQTENVDVEGVPPDLGVAVHEGGPAQVARVVDENVDGAQVLFDPLEGV